MSDGVTSNTNPFGEPREYEIKGVSAGNLDDDGVLEIALVEQTRLLAIRSRLLENHEGGMAMLWFITTEEMEELYALASTSQSLTMRVLMEQFKVSLDARLFLPNQEED